MRVLRGVPSLRNRQCVAELQRSFSEGCTRAGFRLVHYSIQTDHLHMLVEASDSAALGRGMMAIGSRIARAVNRVFRRAGKVMAGRYHVRMLTSPRQVWNALRYVLLNVRKHVVKRTGRRPPVVLDAASSAAAFDGWKRRPRGSTSAATGVARAESWLLRVGWRRHGAIDPADVPGFS